MERRGMAGMHCSSWWEWEWSLYNMLKPAVLNSAVIVHVRPCSREDTVASAIRHLIAKSW